MAITLLPPPWRHLADGRLRSANIGTNLGSRHHQCWESVLHGILPVLTIYLDQHAEHSEVILVTIDIQYLGLMSYCYCRRHGGIRM